MGTIYLYRLLSERLILYCAASKQLELVDVALTRIAKVVRDLESSQKLLC
jgi:hypothetical protein